MTNPDELEVRPHWQLLSHSSIIHHTLLFHDQAEARRFEEAIVSESTKNGRQGIIALPGVREIMQDVRTTHTS